MLLNHGYKLDLAGRVIPVKRGSYKKLPLTKSAARLKSYLKLVTSKSKTGWATIDLHFIASYFQISFRTIQRAKNSIENNHGLEFRTISNESGRRGHKLLVGAVDKIQNDVHQHSVDGKRRNIWQRIGRNKHGVLVQPKSVISSRPNQALMVNAVTPYPVVSHLEISVSRPLLTGFQKKAVL